MKYYYERIGMLGKVMCKIQAIFLAENTENIQRFLYNFSKYIYDALNAKNHRKKIIKDFRKKIGVNANENFRKMTKDTPNFVKSGFYVSF